MLAYSNIQFVLIVIVVIFTAFISIAPGNIRITQSTYYWLEYEKSSVNPEGNHSFRTDAEAETPILWPPDAKNWLTRKDPDAEKDWRQEEKRTTEDEMVEWHHPLNGHEFEQAPGVGDGQGSLVC